MIGRTLLSMATHDSVRRVVTSLPLSHRVSSRFVAGESEADAIRVTGELAGAGLLTTIDHLGEDTTDPAGATAATLAYLSLLEGLAAGGLSSVAEVSVKLTAIGLGLPDGEVVALANARRIVERAAATGTTVTVDMEDHTWTTATLDVVRALRVDRPDVGVVLQAYLRRTEADVEEFATPGSRVRLCKGAYREPIESAYVDRGEISASYSRCLHLLMSRSDYPMVATHDPQLIDLAIELAGRNSRGADSFEFQLLNGVRPDEQSRLAAAGYRVRVYLPYGQQWYGYMMRRMAEKPANLALFVRAMTSRR